jgi:hypothetical protein
MAIVFTESAAKHGFTRADAAHAIASAVYVQERFSPSRVPELPDPTLYLGPAPTGELLEVMVYVDTNNVVIFHVMAARAKFLRWL